MATNYLPLVSGEKAPEGWDTYNLTLLMDLDDPITMDVDSGAFRVNRIPGTRVVGGWAFQVHSPQAPMVSFNLPQGGNYPSRKRGWFVLTGVQSWIKNGIQFLEDPRMDLSDSESFAVMTLNLHTYQESNSLEKLEMVGRFLVQAKVDIALFQEMAQNRNSEFWQGGPLLREDHMIFPILQGAQSASTRSSNRFTGGTRENLQEHFIWDWAHYGWAVWEEGLGILSAVGSGQGGSRYVSSQKTKDSIDSRMAIFREITVLEQKILLVSTHLSWGEVQLEQLEILASLVEEKGLPALICGDFNMRENTENYRYLTSELGWRDSVEELQVGHTDQSTFENGNRIDYVFLTPDFPFLPKQIQRVFTDSGEQEVSFRRVSDHYGLMVRFSL